MSTFKVLYFAAATNYTKCASETWEAPLSVPRLFELLERKYKGIHDAVLSNSLVAVNLGYVDVDEKTMIKPGDEVAIIPPVSAG